jgi:hypothetical protein
MLGARTVVILSLGFRFTEPILYKFHPVYHCVHSECATALVTIGSDVAQR